jgi:type I restriction enzyme, S subunit
MSSKTKTTATKEQTTPALVPKLRFPGFSNPWAHEPLSKVLKEHKLKNSVGRDVFSVSMEYGIVNQIELLGRSFAAADTSHYTIGRRFDVVYTKSPLKAFPFGVVKQCKFDGEVALSPLYGVFTPPNPHLGLMIEAYFESPNRSKAFLSPLCQKGAKNTLQITNTTFLSGRLPLPTQPAEQQKIAFCLSSVDELIAAQARKLDALKTHKKGLMQQLFPREGETQPRLRFPEFKNAGEWEPKLLGDAVKSFKTGKLDANAMVENGQYRFYTCAKNYYQIDKYAFEGEALLVAGNGAHLGYIHHYIGKFNAYQRTYVLQNFKANVVFLRCLLERYLPSRIQFEKKDGNTPYIVLSTLTEMPLVIPKDAAEQKRIASCLTSLDDLIAAQTQKLSALKTHKKGLMQQLFPSPEEVEA